MNYGKKIMSIYMSVCLAAGILSGCAGMAAEPTITNAESESTGVESEITDAEPTNKVEESTEADKESSNPDEELTEKVQSKVTQMSMKEKVAQMIMPAIRVWNSTPENPDAAQNVVSLNSELEDMIKNNDFAGICLFAQNCQNTEQIVKLTDQIQSAASQSDQGIPMFLSIDQEGGYITRLTTGTSGIGNMAIAATGNPMNAKKEAEMIGNELAALGINIDFAPSVDVNSNPDNPIIGVRSFSDKPEVVAEYAAEFVNGLKEKNIIGCLKHFPGHGDTDVDSHTGLPLVSKTHDELTDSDLIPFAEIANDADMIMTAHIQFPNIEDGTYKSISTGDTINIPATLSNKIVSGILRDEIGFNGVVVTDAFDMDAIAQNFDPMDSAKLAINAGIDIILMPVTIKDSKGIEEMNNYIDGIVKMVEFGEIPESELDDSVKRILALKFKRGLFNQDETSIEDKVANALSIVGSQNHHDEEWDMALQAITLSEGRESALEKITDNTKVLTFVPADSMSNSLDFAAAKLIDDSIISNNGNIHAESYESIESDTSASYKSMITEADEIIIITKFQKYSDTDASNPDNFKAQFVAGIIRLARENGKKVIVISSLLPYDSVRYTDADAVLLAYNPSSMMEYPKEYKGNTKKYGVNIPAALYIALGGAKPVGTCPVDLP